MNRTTAVTAVLLVLAALTLTIHFGTTDIEFSRYNIEWTGTSGFFAALESTGAVGITSLSGLPGPRDALLLVIAPGSPYTPEEADALRAFLDDGNILVIADETGESGSLLEGLGSSIAIVPGNLSSIERAFPDPRAVIVTPRTEDPLLSGVASLTLNHASAVSGGEILLATTLFSWMDTNGNGRLDQDETLASYGVLSREAIGNGTLYVLSDASLFSNGMQRARLAGDNDLFLGNILAARPVVLVEQHRSLTAGAEGILALVLVVKSTMVIKILLLILSMTIVWVVFSRRLGEWGRA
ncbi:MAG TPA: DUF4350 domain-containing protein [Methanoregulaceae archaeon]|jgi:hypothetical protein|nr:DUF4350 domain-containing protein [Methanoregulaceae archaeon]